MGCRWQRPALAELIEAFDRKLHRRLPLFVILDPAYFDEQADSDAIGLDTLVDEGDPE